MDTSPEMTTSLRERLWDRAFLLGLVLAASMVLGLLAAPEVSAAPSQPQIGGTVAQ